MTTYAIVTTRYEIDLHSLLTRRLQQCGCLYGMTECVHGLMITVQEGDQAARLATALALLIGKDLMQLELARYVDGLPMNLQEKQSILAGVLQQLRGAALPDSATADMNAYLSQADNLNLEGYLLFRMRHKRMFGLFSTITALIDDKINRQKNPDRRYPDLNR